MSKDRGHVAAATRESVLKEFNHRCAVCGADRPHLHHIDEDPSNSEPANLIPLCPNHHLVDQHDATNAMPQGKLRLLRQYKHRGILKPQFNPVYRRMEFLYSLGDADDVEALEKSAGELVGLVQSLAMGEFYGDAIRERVCRPQFPCLFSFEDDAAAMRMRVQLLAEAQAYREQLRCAVPEVEALVVEMLDFQTWGGVEDANRSSP